MLITVADCLRRASELESISDSARLDVELLLGHVLEKNRTWLFTWPEKLVAEDAHSTFLSLLKRRVQGEPIAHILGEREFWSLPLYVDSSTLIPRPDTEALVETAIELTTSPDNILDLGTGTGAIALALASEFPNANVVAVDKSPQAVALAQRNLQRLQFNHVTILESDWFAALNKQRFDVIVSNPPYIDEHDPHLAQGDVRFEPVSALIAGEAGLADIRFIIESAQKHLSLGGVLLLEHGWRQAQAVQRLFEQNGYAKIETRKDIGGNDRVTLGWKPQ